jgi:hypothetical protein
MRLLRSSCDHENRHGMKTMSILLQELCSFSASILAPGEGLSKA